MEINTNQTHSTGMTKKRQCRKTVMMSHAAFKSVFWFQTKTFKALNLHTWSPFITHTHSCLLVLAEGSVGLGGGLTPGAYFTLANCAVCTHGRPECGRFKLSEYSRHMCFYCSQIWFCFFISWVNIYMRKISFRVWNKGKTFVHLMIWSWPYHLAASIKRLYSSPDKSPHKIKRFLNPPHAFTSSSWLTETQICKLNKSSILKVRNWVKFKFDSVTLVRLETQSFHTQTQISVLTGGKAWWFRFFLHFFQLYWHRSYECFLSLVIFLHLLSPVPGVPWPSFPPAWPKTHVWKKLTLQHFLLLFKYWGRANTNPEIN